MVTGAGVLRGLGRRSLAAAGGLVLDRLLGEPPVPDRAHPVALFGSGVAALERRLYADRRAPGAVLAAAAVAGAGAAGAVLRSPVAAAWLAASGRALHDAALRVAAALETGDLDAARAALPWLVGRDPTGLDATAIARAAIESVAENTTDAVVAPALWATAAGATGTFAHRAADTVDSMVGYRDERYRRFGAAAARLDDVLAFVPARVTAALVVLCRPGRAPAVRRAVAVDAPAHPSPNAGVAEAAFAAARRAAGRRRQPLARSSSADRCCEDGRCRPADVRRRGPVRAVRGRRLLASAGLAALAAARCATGGEAPMTAGRRGGRVPPAARGRGAVAALRRRSRHGARPVGVAQPVRRTSPHWHAATSASCAATPTWTGPRRCWPKGSNCRPSARCSPPGADHRAGRPAHPLRPVDERVLALPRHLERLDRARWRSDPQPLRPAGGTGKRRVGRGVPAALGRRVDRDGGWALGSLTKALRARPALGAVAPDGRRPRAQARRPAWAVGGWPARSSRRWSSGPTPGAGPRRSPPPGQLGGCSWPGWSPLLRRAWVLVPGAGLRDALARRAVVVRDCRSFGLPTTSASRCRTPPGSAVGPGLAAVG